MAQTCLNCNKPVEGNFCSQCGQPTTTHTINAHYLWHDIQHAFLHVDKGILFTTKEMFTRPGHSIREFLEGKRVKHFKPISYVLILAGVYGFLSHYFHINMLSNNIEVSGSGEQLNEVKETVAGMSEWLAQHYAFFALFQIPVFSIGTYLAFRKAGYNFLEHIIVNTFLTGQRLVLRIATFPLYYLYNETPELRTTARIIDAIGYALIFWSLYQLFDMLNKSQRVWRMMLSLAIAFSILFLTFLAVFQWVVGSIIK